ncbi:hypothetical protein BU26DRAFT_571941 [Trematosphaeria pertusa]|uniref:Uncharacterized protein n=1 Tax=Trematosphaeria pertusa TaxID=390896 RepID=A0A6A6HTH9_9PLEO|nr:uncharacterized protein BU26DRAFT_571941 [Trematosphaeria pertusa]KAF2241475.1 hypothetical protein BU26DRAFT_571941 [Trematosphaeria pertusa]
MALDHKLLGGESKVIRITQLSPDSWMILGYQYDDGTSGPCTCADRMSTSHGGATHHGTIHPEDEDNGKTRIEGSSRANTNLMLPAVIQDLSEAIRASAKERANRG